MKKVFSLVVLLGINAVVEGVYAQDVKPTFKFSTPDFDSVGLLNKKNDIDFDSVSGSYIKVVVVNKKNPFLFDKYIDEIVARNPFDLKIVENFDEYLSDNVGEESLELTDTITLLNTYVDSVQTDLDRDRIKNKLQELYVEAQTLDAL